METSVPSAGLNAVNVEVCTVPKTGTVAEIESGSLSRSALAEVGQKASKLTPTAKQYGVTRMRTSLAGISILTSRTRTVYSNGLELQPTFFSACRRKVYQASLRSGRYFRGRGSTCNLGASRPNSRTLHHPFFLPLRHRFARSVAAN